MSSHESRGYGHGLVPRCRVPRYNYKADTPSAITREEWERLLLLAGINRWVVPFGSSVEQRDVVIPIGDDHFDFPHGVFRLWVAPPLDALVSVGGLGGPQAHVDADHIYEVYLVLTDGAQTVYLLASAEDVAFTHTSPPVALPLVLEFTRLDFADALDAPAPIRFLQQMAA